MKIFQKDLTLKRTDGCIRYIDLNLPYLSLFHYLIIFSYRVIILVKYVYNKDRLVCPYCLQMLMSDIWCNVSFPSI